MSVRLSSDSRFKSWFSKRTARHNETRDGAEVYKLYGASTVRFQNSPLNKMRRYLNELELLKSPYLIVNLAGPWVSLPLFLFVLPFVLPGFLACFVLPVFIFLLHVLPDHLKNCLPTRRTRTHILLAKRVTTRSTSSDANRWRGMIDTYIVFHLHHILFLNFPPT